MLGKNAYVEGDYRIWDGCMELPTQWTCVWANSKRWWRTGKPGVLQSMGLQRVRHNWVTEQIKSKQLQQQHMNWELPDVQLDFKKAEIKYLLGHRNGKRIPEKTSASASLTVLKPLVVWITTNCWKFLKRGEYQAILPASWETCMQVKKQQ